MRFFAVALVALGATQPDVDLDPATRNRLYWGPDSLYIPVYMIAPTKLYTKRQAALRELGLQLHGCLSSRTVARFVQAS